jgi:tetraacyldisaccharide 4'-kinase
MSLARRFDDIVSGNRQDLAAAIARGTLGLLEKPYAGAIGLRNRYYDRSAGAVKAVKVPVISVGNLTMGGTGKTPMVAWLAQEMLQRGRTPVIVSRGYRAKPQKTSAGQKRATAEPALNDEGQELQWRLPGVAHVQNPDRVQGAQVAIDLHGADVIVLDDGFQHRRLHRDLNIVLIDATQPFGYDRVFPRGTLREPVTALRRADVVIVTRSDQVDEATLAHIRQRATPLCPHAVWSHARHQATHLANAEQQAPIETLRSSRVAAFCAIGRPDAFRQTLEDCGQPLVGFREFHDHHTFREDDFASLAKWAQSLAADALVCTQKDFVKIDPTFFTAMPVWSLAIELTFAEVDQQEEISQRLDKLVGLPTQR